MSMNFNEYSWDIIAQWLPNTTRKGLLENFNFSSKEAYISGQLPILMKLTVTSGETVFKHETSRFLGSGLRIKIVSEQALTKDQCIVLAMVILVNPQLVRRLMVLGWDTLEIVYTKVTGGYKTSEGIKWELKKFAQLEKLSS